MLPPAIATALLRYRIGLAAAAMLLAGLAWAGAYDQALVWWMAQWRDADDLFWLSSSWVEGRAPGVGDFFALVYFLTALAYAWSRTGTTPGALAEHQGKIASVMATGWNTFIIVAALRLAFARVRPSLVLGGTHPYTDWYETGALALSQVWSLSSFPAMTPALTAASAAFTLAAMGKRLAPGSVGAMLSATLPAGLLAGLIGGVGIYAQAYWPTDVLAGTGIGLACAAAGAAADPVGKRTLPPDKVASPMRRMARTALLAGLFAGLALGLRQVLP